MTKVRQDAWSHEDDLLLAETVLRHIREGSTQLDAFEEVGDRLNRTGAACGFRWNAIVRKKYEQAIEIAKKQRKQKKRAEQRGRIIRPVAPAFPVMETASMPDPAPFTSEAPIDLPESENTHGASAAPNPLTMHDVIHFLQTIQNGGETNERVTKENAQLKEENHQLKKRIEELEHEVENLNNRQQTVEDDYQALIGIMDRARRMVAFKEQDEADDAPAFKMDQNGNLEKIAK
ncbi:RsfA family transcriptional regulator [Sporolactobacillus sp. CPB3-1]|uniref:RsfA family transcriptional regulator n=1 Tax=Sporolactobacillus mangiferae TaxID=2940498 RepID=A0ABT0M744_9BACL|nr:RsfA family transcriptional regulator [Sporolactobacillus mangiferae]MCL1630473.1 RsfA family transcriptional regulator [Sporolactobacillus mangiferae]